LRFTFELLRDVLGLLGAILSASAFFRLERRKAEAAGANPDAADDVDLKTEMVRARNTLVARRVLAPNEVDLRLTFWGLTLIAISFLISIGLTITAPSRAEAPYATPSMSPPAKIPTGTKADGT